VLDVTVHDRLVTDTPVHLARDRWMTCVQRGGQGSYIHHGDHDQAELITTWIAGGPERLTVGVLSRRDSRLTLTRHDDTVRVEVAYLPSGHLSVGVLTITAGQAGQWAAWLRAWFAAHPAPVGQLALFASSAAAAA
jgi:hypothetical protein